MSKQTDLQKELSRYNKLEYSPKKNRIKELTPFEKAFKDYKELVEYKELVDLLKNKGMNQPYIDNVIYRIFTAGYNSK